MDQLRNPPAQHISSQPWILWLRGLPSHPKVQLASSPGALEDGLVEPPLSDQERAAISGSVLLAVSRPPLVLPPEPPPELTSWLHHGWDTIDGLVEVHPTRSQVGPDGSTVEELFQDDPSRPLLLDQWTAKRSQWERSERPAFEAWKLFERLYELHGQLDREAEKVELVLGDGILSWRVDDIEIRHPLILQRLQLHLNPSVPRVLLAESDRSVELYTPLLRSIPSVDGKLIGQFREELEQEGYHPLGGDDTSDFLRRLAVRLSPRGELAKPTQRYRATAYPVIHRDPVIFLRTRTLGFSSALESILQDISFRTELPEALLNIVGVGTSARPTTQDVTISPAEEELRDDVLFSKPANREQFQIARRLESHGAVLTQGPPGTGKTHTIANLLGHLLAQGKSVLVTSHTSKALRILRDQVVPELQPLCVSVLDNDVESRRQLERSVTAISERLSSTSFEQLDFEASVLRRERSELLARQSAAKKALLGALSNEYETIETYNNAYSPSDAARIVCDGVGRYDWIPGPLIKKAPIPLSPEEARNLYLTNRRVSFEDELELHAPLPLPTELPDPDRFERLVSLWHQMKDSQSDFDPTLWEENGSSQDPAQLTSVMQSILQAVRILADPKKWQLEAIDAGRKGGVYRRVWDDLIELIVGVNESAARAAERTLSLKPRLADEIPIADQKRTIDEIAKYLQHHRRLGWLALIQRSSWRRFLKGAKVGGSRPSELEQIRALQEVADLSIARDDLTDRWEFLMASREAGTIPRLDPQPERTCAQAVEPLREALSWYENVWKDQERALHDVGFRWSVLLNQTPPELKDYGEILRLHKTARERLPLAFQARTNRLKFEMVERDLLEYTTRLSHYITDSTSAQIAARLREAVVSRDSSCLS
ncbi:MAG: AAA family ATPase, partial [Candidatus Marsarchaeota archaeon]|nr:AAA family ATPase [Candidatus Marsarchaeota archaeon]